MCELKKWKGIYEKIFWNPALVLWKKNLPGRGLSKTEKNGLGHYSLCLRKHIKNFSIRQNL